MKHLKTSFVFVLVFGSWRHCHYWNYYWEYLIYSYHFYYSISLHVSVWHNYSKAVKWDSYLPVNWLTNYMPIVIYSSFILNSITFVVNIPLRGHRNMDAKWLNTTLNSAQSSIVYFKCNASNNKERFNMKEETTRWKTATLWTYMYKFKEINYILLIPTFNWNFHILSFPPAFIS